MVSWSLTECFVLFIVIDFIIYDFQSLGFCFCAPPMLHVPQSVSCLCLWDSWFLGFVPLPSMFSVSHLQCRVCSFYVYVCHLSSLSAVSPGQFLVAVLVLCFLVYFHSGGAYPRCHRVRSGVHPGHTSSLSQDSLSDFA